MRPSGQPVPCAIAARPRFGWLLDVAAALALTAWYYRYGLAHLGGALYDTFDQKLVVYLLEWSRHCCFGAGRIADLFDANMLYPNRNVLAWTETFLGFLPLYALVRLFTANLVLALNCVALVAAFAAALGMLRLGRALTGRTAFIAAVVGAVGLSAASQEGHFQMKALALFVWALVVAVRFVRGSRWALPALVILGVWLFLASLYLAIMLAVVVASSVAVCGAVGRGRFLRWLRGTIASSHPIAAGAATLAAVPALLWVGAHYLEVKRRFGGYPLEDSGPYSARLGSLLDATPASVLYPTLYWDWGSHEARLFFGVAVWLAVAVLAVRWRRWGMSTPDRALVALLAFATLLCIVLAFGPYQRDALAHAVRLPMPGRLYAAFFPGYSALRTSGRWGQLAAVFLALLAEVGVRSALGATLLRRPSAIGIAYAAIAAAFVLDQATVLRPTPIDLFPRRAVYDAIRARTPPDAVVLEVPVTRDGHFPTLAWWQDQMVGSTLHWRRIPVGYSGHPSSTLDRLVAGYQALEAGTASAGAFLDAVRGMGVTHLVLDDDLAPPAVTAGLRTVLAARPATPLAPHASLYTL